MDFKNWETWHYMIAGCGVLLVLAIILYFVPGGRLKISGMVSCGLVCLVVGIGLGVVTMFGFGYHWEGEPTPRSNAAGGGGGRMGGMGGGKGEGGSKKGEGGSKKGKSGEPPPGVVDDAKTDKKGEKEGTERKDKSSDAKKGNEEKTPGADMIAGMQAAGKASMGNYKPPSNKELLITLVAKLDLVTGKAPLVNLTDEQKAKLREKLKDLDSKTEIKEQDAEKMLIDILDIVEGDRKSLETAGFRWPGTGGPSPSAQMPPNPFKEKANAEHLKALQEHLSGK